MCVKEEKSQAGVRGALSTSFRLTCSRHRGQRGPLGRVTLVLTPWVHTHTRPSRGRAPGAGCTPVSTEGGRSHLSQSDPTLYTYSQCLATSQSRAFSLLLRKAPFPGNH